MREIDHDVNKSGERKAQPLAGENEGFAERSVARLSPALRPPPPDCYDHRYRTMAKKTLNPADAHREASHASLPLLW